MSWKLSRSRRINAVGKTVIRHLDGLRIESAESTSLECFDINITTASELSENLGVKVKPLAQSGDLPVRLFSVATTDFLLGSMESST